MKDCKVLISLVGQQPVPNLLPILHLCPAHVVLACTTTTQSVAGRLKSVLKRHAREQKLCQSAEIVMMDPYDIDSGKTRITEFVRGRFPNMEGIVFNLTGGTKPMTFAAFLTARALKQPFCYLVSEGPASVLHIYSDPVRLTEAEKVKVPNVVTIDQYLRVHFGGYTEGPLLNEFEQQVYKALKPHLEEVKTSVRPNAYKSIEIDFVLRQGNAVGIAEVKSGGRSREKRGVEQVVTSGERNLLGAFTKKNLILDREYDPNNAVLAKGLDVNVIELPSAQNGPLSQKDANTLVNSLKMQFGTS